jgi:hypothetical protein
MRYNVISIDPRPAQKDAMIELLQQSQPVFGIEFTLPALVPYIDCNIDDQHVPNAAGKAAIEIATSIKLPPTNTTLAIVRADADAIGAIAILNLRARGEVFDQTRVTYIAQEDTFARGSWPGVRPVVLKNEHLLFKALGSLAMNFKMPLQERVSLFESWLATGDCDGLSQAIDNVVSSLKAAIEQSNVVVDTGIAVVESRHIGATEIAYHHAPIAIIRNDAFRFPGVDGVHVKYTICQFTPQYLDLKAAVAALNEAEQSDGTWGGSPTIAGSPQGVSSTLSLIDVVTIVKQYVK